MPGKGGILGPGVSFSQSWFEGACASARFRQKLLVGPPGEHERKALVTGMIHNHGKGGTMRHQGSSKKGDLQNCICFTKKGSKAKPDTEEEGLDPKTVNLQEQRATKKERGGDFPA